MAEEEEKKSGKTLIIVLLGVGVLLLLVLAVGATLFMTGAFDKNAAGETSAAETPQEAAVPAVKRSGTPIYHPLKSFTVNFQDTSDALFLQVDVQIMTYDETVLEEIRLHDPVIRNQLLMLFSQQNSRELRTREGKEMLRQQALEEMRRIMTERTGRQGIEDLFFTSFVMQ